MFTVDKFFSLPGFSGLHLLAGRRGLHRTIRRILVENDVEFDPENCVHLHDFLLFHGGDSSRWRYMIDLFPKLLSKGVSGIGVRPRAAPEADPLLQKLLHMAETYDLPVLGIPAEYAYSQLVESFYYHLNQSTRDLEFSHQLLEQLTEVVLSKGHVRDILTQVHELIGEPVVFYSHDFHIVEHIPEDLDPKEAEAVATQLKRKNRYEDLQFQRKYFELDGPLRCCVSPVRSTGKFYGYLVVFSCRSHIYLKHIVAAEHAATALSLYRLQEEAASIVERQYLDHFIQDLIYGRFESAENMIQRARTMGIELQKPRVVFLFQLDDFEGHVYEGYARDEQHRTELNRPLRESIQQTMRLWDIRGLTTDVGGSTVVLVESHSLHELVTHQTDEGRGQLYYQAGSRLREIIQRSIHPHQVSVGIGRVALNVKEIPRSFQQSHRALTLGRKIWGGSGAYHYDRLGSFRFLGDIIDSAEVNNFYRDIFQAFRLLDEKEREELLHTLQTYFQCNMSRSECAAKLYVHPNTIRYRLKKVENITGLNIQNSEDCFNLQLCLKIRELLKLRQAR